MFNIFKRNSDKPKYPLFGRMRESYARSVCDVCGKEVGFCDFVYLCRDCHAKLPEYAKKNHHWLVSMKDARVMYLCKAIIQNAGGDPDEEEES